MNVRQGLVGAGTLALGGLIAVGATQISAEAGYGGVGPNFLPWVVGLTLLACGALLVREAARGGFRTMEQPSGAQDGHWPGFVWVSIGILTTAALITRIGFVLSCALCFVLAVRGFKSAEGRLDLSPRAWIVDLLVGMAIAAPVYWMFGKLLAINLPGLTSTGWI
ncbi:tripartite tricarboxylate transporter TctB family protein [uncultured Piscinibacter sp.]|uniref:tripartite tricarboxylate transporter TctB family protein n=1 Tax=uncultured Piscinibacter sp. TaxID=1131835 RepID=UPI002626D1D6|nr:tripartite tricarboxylate transporter TctB family protein [uncultured Piscinibacter sp.]